MSQVEHSLNLLAAAFYRINLILIQHFTSAFSVSGTGGYVWSFYPLPERESETGSGTDRTKPAIRHRRIKSVICEITSTGSIVCTRMILVLAMQTLQLPVSFPSITSNSIKGFVQMVGDEISGHIVENVIELPLPVRYWYHCRSHWTGITGDLFIQRKEAAICRDTAMHLHYPLNSLLFMGIQQRKTAKTRDNTYWHQDMRPPFHLISQLPGLPFLQQKGLRVQKRVHLTKPNKIN